MNKDKIKNVGLIAMGIALATSIAFSIYTESKYDTSTKKYEAVSDSLSRQISMDKSQYDSLRIVMDSSYTYLSMQNDSLYKLVSSSQKTNKTKVTYIYKDSTIVKEEEATQIDKTAETKYVTQYVDKEVLKVVHDTIQVSRVDTIYKEQEVKTENTEQKSEDEVVVKDDLFNVYIDGNVKGTLDWDIVPEIGAGIIFKEKFYGEIGIDYNNKKVNPSAKLGIRLNVF